MNDVVNCHIHGEQQEAFVCSHLSEALETGDRVGFFWSREPRGDAWCAACEMVRVREGGLTGDWNETSEKFAGIKIVCGAIYDRLRKLHDF